MNCEEYVIKKLKELEEENIDINKEKETLKHKVEETSKIFEVLEENIKYYEPIVINCWDISEKLTKRKLGTDFIDNVINGVEGAFEKAINDYSFGRIDENIYDYKLRLFNSAKVVNLYHDGSFYLYDFDDEKHFANEYDAKVQLKVNLIAKFEEWNRNYRNNFEEKK